MKTKQVAIDEAYGERLKSEAGHAATLDKVEAGAWSAYVAAVGAADVTYDIVTKKADNTWKAAIARAYAGAVGRWATAQDHPTATRQSADASARATFEEANATAANTYLDASGKASQAWYTAVSPEAKKYLEALADNALTYLNAVAPQLVTYLDALVGHAVAAFNTVVNELKQFAESTLGNAVTWLTSITTNLNETAGEVVDNAKTAFDKLVGETNEGVKKLIDADVEAAGEYSDTDTDLALDLGEDLVDFASDIADDYLDEEADDSDSAPSTSDASGGDGQAFFNVGDALDSAADAASAAAVQKAAERARVDSAHDEAQQALRRMRERIQSPGLEIEKADAALGLVDGVVKAQRRENLARLSGGDPNRYFNELYRFLVSDAGQGNGAPIATADTIKREALEQVRRVLDTYGLSRDWRPDPEIDKDFDGQISELEAAAAEQDRLRLEQEREQQARARASRGFLAIAAENPDISAAGHPGFGESLIPIWGSARSAAAYYEEGRWGWGTFYAGLAVTDVFLVRSVVTAGWKAMTGSAMAKSGAAALGGKEAYSILRSGEGVASIGLPGLRAGMRVSTMKELLASGVAPGLRGVVLEDGTVLFRDIYALSVRDGIEYVLTQEGGDFVLRSGLANRVPVPLGVRPIAHTHPPDIAGLVDKLPSRADIDALNRYWSMNPDGPRPVSQIIWGPKAGDTTVFRATGTGQLPRLKIKTRPQ